ncbi:hypothetical protein FRACA_2200002 [Frankia canadensis]|uniref:Uncharacterized protein n=1 Tax=Frankia canadensis TaxID=1836972 RepID=A0A2I2KR12_9ACTN|nr:hypothetical protein FRACA_2200002 [Frankia canadensis]SOU55398.1 hypothetical protein FRACA_2200002 [Frankia canadensis]
MTVQRLDRTEDRVRAFSDMRSLKRQCKRESLCGETGNAVWISIVAAGNGKGFV